MQDDRQQMQIQIRELQEKVEMLEYIVSLYQKGDEYKQQVRDKLIARVAYLEAFLPLDKTNKEETKVISMTNIRKLSLE